MKLLCLCKAMLCLCFLTFSPFSVGHPQDEDIILDIEEGQMNLQSGTIDEEYLAALKRQRLRRLQAMSWGEKMWLYTKAGVEHIVPKGADHILFVLGLYLSSLLFVSLLWQVTAFTLAHSVTLGLAALGLVSVPGYIVEPLIALSIAWVALENCLFKQPSKWRPLVVFMFGLLHGLGFASVLSEYGLPKEDLIPALLAFNVGVELGQLSVLLVAALLTWWFSKKAGYRHYVQIPFSIVIGLVGLYWFVERVFL